MSVEIQEFLYLCSSSRRVDSEKEKHRKSTPNESVKIPIRIKKLYNHNMWAPHRTGEKYRKNIKEKHEREERSKELPAFGVYSDIFIIVIIK